ncbi:MAG: PA14 domain-containing protein [Patescibacteria group bacterium]
MNRQLIILNLFFVAIVVVLGYLFFSPSPAFIPRQNTDFITRSEDTFLLRGKPYRFTGANNYYVIYKPSGMVDAVFATAAKNNLSVIRTWGFVDIGKQDGSESIDGKGKKEAVYFHYWDGRRPVLNEGDTGLKKLDYVLYQAHEKGIRVVLPLVNNWKDFGGMDQYVRWRGGKYHDAFYTDETIKGWYKNYVKTLLNRVNTYTGIAYKDDPTILSWELANEPRCAGSGDYPASESCTPDTIASWADEMSSYIKSIDPNHLVGVGDEGFYCIAGATDTTEDCSEGDSLKYGSLPQIDYLSFHLYPDKWDKSEAWGTSWIKTHLQGAKIIDKPVMLGEFGHSVPEGRTELYKGWLELFTRDGGDGLFVWMLADKKTDNELYPDYDGYTVYCPSDECNMLKQGTKLLAKAPAEVITDVLPAYDRWEAASAEATLVEGKERGLTGYYFAGRSLGGVPVSRIDPQIDFSWDAAAPDRTIPSDNFSARWTGYIVPKQSQKYTFYTRHDDGVRFWINGKLLIDAWKAGEVVENKATFSLKKGKKVAIILEYFEKEASASLQLLWSSKSTKKEVIPSEQLLPF